MSRSAAAGPPILASAVTISRAVSSVGGGMDVRRAESGVTAAVSRSSPSAKATAGWTVESWSCSIGTSSAVPRRSPIRPTDSAADAPHHRFRREGAGLEGAGGVLPRVLRLQERGERLHHRGALRGERRRLGEKHGQADREHAWARPHRAHAGSGMAWSSAATPAGSRVGSN